MTYILQSLDSYNDINGLKDTLDIWIVNITNKYSIKYDSIIKLNITLKNIFNGMSNFYLMKDNEDDIYCISLFDNSNIIYSDILVNPNKDYKDVLNIFIQQLKQIYHTFCLRSNITIEMNMINELTNLSCTYHLDRNDMYIKYKYNIYNFNLLEKSDRKYIHGDKICTDYI